MVAVVVSSDATEAIPLLDDVGGGVYNKGRNNIDDIRKYLFAALFGKSGGNAFTIRNGVVANTAQSTGIWIDARITSTGGAGTQAVGVLAYHALCNRTGHGPYLIIQDTAINLSAPVADASNARIDLLCVMPYDKGAFPADAQHGPKYIWVTGDPAGSPVTPALPTAVADALVLASVFRAANDNTIDQGSITQLYTGAGLHGGVRMLVGGDVVGTNGGYHGEIRGRTTPYIDAGLVTRGHTLQLDYYDEVNTRWTTINAPTLIDTRTAAANGTLNTTEQMDVGGSQTQITFNAVAGHRYKVRYELGHSVGASGNRIICFPRYAAGGTVTTAGTLITSSRILFSDTGFNFTSFTNIFTAPTTGQYTIGVGLKMYSGSSGTVYSTAEPDGNARTLTIEDGEY